jgi:nucleotide-binding universal stress UspA family protein
MELSKVTIKNILYATDLSESAHHAFSYAVSLADQYAARLTLLHVLPDTPDIFESSKIAGYIGEDRWKEMQESHFQDAKNALIGKRRDHHLVQEILGEFSEKTRSAFESPAAETDEIIVKKGNPADVILDVANEMKCDLIVMGTHGRRGLVDAVTGSTTRRVVHRSAIPVLVVRLPEDD